MTQSRKKKEDAPLSKSIVSLALEQIGNSGDTAFKGKSNVGTMLHEYFIATEGEGYFKKRRAAALDHLKESGALEDEPEPGSEAVVAESPEYMLTLKVANPSSRLDRAAIAGALIRMFGATEEQVHAFTEAITKEGEPTKTYKVVPR